MRVLDLQSDSLLVALSQRDAYTAAHCDRVTKISLAIGRACELDSQLLCHLEFASRLHDIGKLGIPDYILLKLGRLTDEELAVMRTHVEISQNVCNRISDPDAQLIGIYVRHHHEFFNGEGYPDKLSGEDIPICSRIVSLADSYDAMLTTRPYHQARSHEKVMEIMESECGVKSDPYLFNQFKIVVNNDAYLK